MWQLLPQRWANMSLGPCPPTFGCMLDLGWRNVAGLFSSNLICSASWEGTDQPSMPWVKSRYQGLKRNPSPSRRQWQLCSSEWLPIDLLPFFSASVLKKNVPYHTPEWVFFNFAICLFACLFWDRLSWILRWPCIYYWGFSRETELIHNWDLLECLTNCSSNCSNSFHWAVSQWKVQEFSSLLVHGAGCLSWSSTCAGILKVGSSTSEGNELASEWE